ncbi:MAG: hypothetical protein LBU89_10420 [Fibromonadaceae bacterium]|jgi:hypothetical protein|nr:hypothetical protein [Fibromonadaceae bacterium]
MRLFPKMPDNMSFWRKLSVFCVMFTGGCLLASRFFPETQSNVEILIWIGGGGLALGIIMQFVQEKKK